MRFSLNQLIDEVRYEITMRQRVYPGMVVRGKMRASEAEFRTDRMKAVLEKLEQLATQEKANG